MKQKLPNSYKVYTQRTDAEKMPENYHLLGFFRLLYQINRCNKKDMLIGKGKSNKKKINIPIGMRR
jgi:hypothetical protein